MIPDLRVLNQPVIANWAMGLLAAVGLLLVGVASGCRAPTQSRLADDCIDCAIDYQQIEYPDLCDISLESTEEFQTVTPPTISEFYELEPIPLTLDEAIHRTLANSKVLNKLGGAVVSAPAGMNTIYDPALQSTNPALSAEAALSAFDAQVSTQLSLDHSERKFNNFFIGAGAATLVQNLGNFQFDMSKTTATGSQFSFRNITTYNKNNSPVNRFGSTWDTVMLAEWRQPLLRGAGTAVNRIAGPNATPGNYNGVLIARIRGDIEIADFELAVRDLVRDVERSYWELYFAYRDLDIKLRAREAARRIWVNRKQKLDAGLIRPDDEAQTRAQYYTFDLQAVNALAGGPDGQSGVFGSERQLRRLMGMNNTDGQILRPVTEPTIAPVLFDWVAAQERMLDSRAELRRQKWNIRQRELELYAACNLNKWRLDFVTNYGARGFGDDLFGNRGVPEGSAWEDLKSGELDDWSFAFDLQGPIGNRVGHLAVRNAQLQLSREKALLREQQKQLMLDLNAAYTEVDRSFVAIKYNYNNRQAVLAELDPKRRRVEAGEEDVFFILDAQQRAATSESAFHRSVVDYNLALMNFIYTAGNMLGHYNIELAEGDWNQCAESYRAINRAKYSYGDRPSRDDCPVSLGPVYDETPLMVFPADEPGPAPAELPSEEE